MKNVCKMNWQRYFKIFALLVLVVPASSGYTTFPQAVQINCPEPGVSVTGRTSDSITFSWSAVEGASAYKVYYVNKSNNQGSALTTTGGTSITFSNLASATYTFYFATTCGTNSSEWIIIDDIVF